MILHIGVLWSISEWLRHFDLQTGRMAWPMDANGCQWMQTDANRCQRMPIQGPKKHRLQLSSAPRGTGLCGIDELKFWVRFALQSRFRRRSHRRSNPVDLELRGTFCPETNAPKPAEARCRRMCLCSCILSPGHGHLESPFCGQSH